MVATLILLYALDTGNIPIGCYVAAWTFSILQTIVSVLKFVLQRKNK